MPDQPDAARREFADVADLASLGLIRFDQQLKVAQANLAAHEALDRRPGSLIGRSLMETFLDHRLEELVRTAVDGAPGAGELDATDRRVVVIRARPSVSGGAWVTLEDVTELRRLERIRSEFVDNVSHELRTPLANVRLLTEMLMHDLAEADVSGAIRDRVATIDVETGHLVQMVNELLDLSRIEQAGDDVRQDAVNMAPVIASATQRLQTFAEKQGVVLVARVPDGLPAVRGDEERLQQVLMNLLHNAIKFSPDGGTVTLTTDEHPDDIVISVADEGEGIPTQDQARVFERFYKVDRARQRAVGGTGLGLAVARHIVEAHDGRIWLDSTEGVGSTFNFSLPIA